MNTALILAAVVAQLGGTPVLESRPSPEATLQAPTMICTVLDRYDTNGIAGRRQPYHGFLCIDALGSILGALQRGKIGLYVCGIQGAVDLRTGCYAATGCGMVTSGCV